MALAYRLSHRLIPKAFYYLGVSAEERRNVLTFVCLFVCLSVTVCLRARLLKNCEPIFMKFGG